MTEENVYLTELEDKIIELKLKVQAMEDILIKFKMMPKR